MPEMQMYSVTLCVLRMGLCNFCQAEEINTRGNILLRKRNVNLVPDSADIECMGIFYKAFFTDFLVEMSGKCRTEKTYF